ISGHQLATRAVVMAEDDPKSREIRAKRAELEEAQSPSKAAVPSQTEIKPEPDESARPSTKKVAGKSTSRKSTAPKEKEKETSEAAIKVEDGAPSTLPPPTPAPGKPLQMHKVMVEGYGLRACLNTPGIDPYHTTTNSIIETYQVLGIEAARSTIIREIAIVTRDLSIDPRHMMLLAD
ncbi:MAG: hypothetical protein M1823_008463, partial [Watsoniomyces obsoletus]